MLNVFYININVALVLRDAVSCLCLWHLHRVLTRNGLVDACLKDTIEQQNTKLTSLILV